MRCWLAGLALLLMVGFATDASAHAALVAVEPATGSVLARPPKAVVLRFDETVIPGAIRLIDAEGRARDDAGITAAGDTISVTVPQDLPPGTAVLSYRVVSEDGHPVAGSVTFSIGAPTATELPSGADRRVNALIWLARVGLYIGLFTGVGGVFFANWIAGSKAGVSVTRAALVVGLGSAVATLGLSGVDLIGLSPAALLTRSPWTIVVTTSTGPAVLIAILAMLLSALALSRAATGCARALSAVALGGVGLALAISGHAATAPPGALTRPAIFLHGLGIAFWIGALAPLAALLSQPAEALPVLNRFSRLAVPAVAVLALTGLLLAIIQVGRLAALVGTRYGIILLIKLALVAALLALAAANRFRLTPALARDHGAAPALRRSIVLECVLALAIFAVVAGWRFTPPPRSIVPAPPLAVHIHSDKAMFQVLVSPGRVGTDDIVLQLMNGEGALLQAKEVTLALSLPERGLEPMEHQAALGADGYWHLRKVELPFGGRWHIRIDALVTDFEKVTLEDDLEVPP